MMRLICTAAFVLASSFLELALAQTAPTTVVTNTDDREFVTQAARVTMLDLAAASEVEQKIEDPAYKAYAKRVITDDTTMQGALQAVARSVGAAIPNGLDQERALVLKDLQASDDAQLEQKFRSSQIGGTRQAIEMFHDFERNARDPKMKMWAATALPALQKHLEDATRLPEVPSAPQG